MACSQVKANLSWDRKANTLCIYWSHHNQGGTWPMRWPLLLCGHRPTHRAWSARVFVWPHGVPAVMPCFFIFWWEHILHERWQDEGIRGLTEHWLAEIKGTPDWCLCAWVELGKRDSLLLGDLEGRRHEGGPQEQRPLVCYGSEMNIRRLDSFQ